MDCQSYELRNPHDHGTLPGRQAGPGHRQVRPLRCGDKSDSGPAVCAADAATGGAAIFPLQRNLNGRVTPAPGRITVLVATHDGALLALADSVLRLEGGYLAEPAGARRAPG